MNCYFNYLEEAGVGAPAWKERLDFEISLISKKPTKVIDMGCGDGLLLGYIKWQNKDCECIGIDDYGDDSGYSETQKTVEKIGVKFISNDISSYRENDLRSIFQNSTDIIALNTIEHWHFSPKGIIEVASHCLLNQGKIIIAMPNNSNLKKRWLAVTGKTEWSKFETWYETEETLFRGHIREPNYHDLLKIGRKLVGFKTRIYGKNFIGLNHPNPKIKRLVRLINPLIEIKPSLCSDLYSVYDKCS